MTGRLRRRTTCTVAGHGTRCEVSREKPTSWPRTAERRLALAYEDAADGPNVVYLAAKAALSHPDPDKETT